MNLKIMILTGISLIGFAAPSLADPNAGFNPGSTRTTPLVYNQSAVSLPKTQCAIATEKQKGTCSKVLDTCGYIVANPGQPVIVPEGSYHNDCVLASLDCKTSMIDQLGSCNFKNSGGEALCAKVVFFSNQIVGRVSGDCVELPKGYKVCDYQLGKFKKVLEDLESSCQWSQK